MDFPFGAVIGAGSSLLGGLLNREAHSDASRKAEDQFSNQWRLQQQMAQGGLTWRAHDAMKAYKETGIHPLSMLGVSGPSYSPISMVGTADNSMGDAISNAGQSVSRAINATKTVDERDRVFVDAARDLALKKGELELQLLSSQLRRMNMVGPAMPSSANPSTIPGQGDAPGVNTTILLRDSYRADDPASRAGAVRELDYMKTPQGAYVPVPTEKGKERIEDDFWAQTGFMMRNNLAPMFGSNWNPPHRPDPGFKWAFNPIDGYYQVRMQPGDAWHSPNRHPSERR